MKIIGGLGITAGVGGVPIGYIFALTGDVFFGALLTLGCATLILAGAFLIESEF